MESKREARAREAEEMRKRLDEKKRAEEWNRFWAFWFLLGCAAIFGMVLWGASQRNAAEWILPTAFWTFSFAFYAGWTRGKRTGWEDAKRHYESSDPWTVWEALALPDANDRLREIAGRLLRKTTPPASVLVERISLDPPYHEKLLGERKVVLRRVKRLLRAVESGQETGGAPEGSDAR